MGLGGPCPCAWRAGNCGRTSPCKMAASSSSSLSGSEGDSSSSSVRRGDAAGKPGGGGKSGPECRPGHREVWRRRNHGWLAQVRGRRVVHLPGVDVPLARPVVGGRRRGRVARKPRGQACSARRGCSRACSPARTEGFQPCPAGSRSRCRWACSAQRRRTRACSAARTWAFQARPGGRRRTRCWQAWPAGTGQSLGCRAPWPAGAPRKSLKPGMAPAKPLLAGGGGAKPPLSGKRGGKAAVAGRTAGGTVVGGRVLRHAATRHAARQARLLGRPGIAAALGCRVPGLLPLNAEKVLAEELSILLRGQRRLAPLRGATGTGGR